MEFTVSDNWYHVTLDEILNEDFLPLYIQMSEVPEKLFEHWILHRCIPDSRDGLKDLMKHTGCASRLELSMKNRMLSLSDHYWVRKNHEHKTWEEVNLFDHDYSFEIGNIIVGTSAGKINNYRSPDITTNGWLKKAWRRDQNGTDYLFKLGSAPYYQEPFNELFCSELLDKFCKLDFVKHELGTLNGKYCSICRNFVTREEEFVPAFEIYRTAKKPFYMEPYEFLLDRCQAYGIKGAGKFIDTMLAFDYLIGNKDRHMGNFGFMRNIKTRKFTGPAPLFDNGTSLWNDILEHTGKREDIDRPFKEWQKEQIRFIRNWDQMKLGAAKEMSYKLEDLLAKSGADRKRISAICKNYDMRWNSLNEIYQHKLERRKEREMEKDES